MTSIFLSIIQLLSLLIIAEALLSWVQSPHQTPRAQLSQLTSPIYAPIRQLIPMHKIGIDLSPIIVLVALNVIAGAIAAA